MGQTVELHAADGHRFSAYQAGPEHAKAGVVVVQEIFGVNSHIRNIVDRYAALGYAAIAPALFDRAERGVELGYLPEDIQRGIALRGKVSNDQALADVLAAAAALHTPSKFITGFCWGGTMAWIAATQSSVFDAASGWYGGAIAQTKNAAPRCPVQLHFGETDHSIPMSDVEAIRAAQPGVEIHVYPAGHGFGCDERSAYNSECSALAQSRTLEFFSKHTKG